MLTDKNPHPCMPILSNIIFEISWKLHPFFYFLTSIPMDEHILYTNHMLKRPWLKGQGLSDDPNIKLMSLVLFSDLILLKLYVETKYMQVWQDTRPKTLEFGYMLSSNTRGFGKMSNSIPLCSMYLTHLSTIQPWQTLFCRNFKYPFLQSSRSECTNDS